MKPVIVPLLAALAAAPAPAIDDRFKAALRRVAEEKIAKLKEKSRE